MQVNLRTGRGAGRWSAAVRAGLSAVAVIVAAAVPSATRADTLSTPTLIPGKSSNVRITYLPAGLNNSQVGAGALSTSLNGGPAFDAYCIDLFHTVAGAYQVNVKPVQALNNPGIISGRGAAAGWLYDTFASSVNSGALGAGLQVAIWEVLYDTNVNLSSGNFILNNASSAIVAAANNYLAAYTAQIPNGFPTTAKWFESKTHGPNNNINQDLVGVPEPSSVVLVGIGLVGAVAVARRRAGRPALA